MSKTAKQRSAEWYARNKESEKARTKAYRANLDNADRVLGAGRRWRGKNPLKVLLLGCINRAKVKGLACTISIEDLERLTAPMVCSVTGISLTWDWEGDTQNPWAPSIDRLDNAEGYIAGNVRVVCWAYNKARSDWPDEVFHKLAMAYSGRSP